MNLANIARKFLDGFTYNPGHSDLDNEQPIHVRVTLGDWRKLHHALSDYSEKQDAHPDTKRLDWLESQGMLGINHEGYGDYTHYAGAGFPPIREVIDKEMEKDADRG